MTSVIPALRPSALVFCYHSWRRKGQGGVHKLTEALCGAGLDVDFVTFPRPYYALLKRKEQLNARLILSLLWGKRFHVGDVELYNFTCPTLELPSMLQGRLSADRWATLETMTFPSLVSRIARRRRPYRCVLFESTPCVQLYPEIRRGWPEALIVYRPSDPLPHATTVGRSQDCERLLLREADLVLLTNEASRALYAEAYPEIDLTSSRIQILPNGVDLDGFKRSWPRPEEYGAPPVVAYIGALPVDWPAVFHAADQMADVRFIVISPSGLDQGCRPQIARRTNLRYIPGIQPGEVPRYVMHADVIMIPYLAGTYLRTHRLHAKVLQAMAARRPIVAMNLSREVEQYGMAVAGDEADFVSHLRAALRHGPVDYNVPLVELSWPRIQQRFLDLYQDVRSRREAAAPVDR